MSTRIQEEIIVAKAMLALQNGTDPSKIVTSQEEKKQLFKCSLCTNAYAYRSGLSRHMARHSGKTYQCPLCNRFFTRSDSLNCHFIVNHLKHITNK